MVGSDNEKRMMLCSIVKPPSSQQQNIQPQIITTVSNNNAKFPYLKKFSYELGGNAESKKMRKSYAESKNFRSSELSEAEGLHNGPSHSAFVSTTSASKKMSYADSLSYSSSTYTASSNSKTGSHRSESGRKIDFDKKESARFNKKKVRCYKCLQRGHFARECRAKGGNDKQRYSSFKIQEIGKKEEDSKALITVDTLVNWTEHDGQSDGVIVFKEFGMIASCDTEDAIEEGAAKIYNLITGADTKEASTAGDAGEFALMGVTSKVHNYPFGCDNKYNELQKQHNELNEQNSEYFIQVQAYKNSLKTLEKQKRVLQKNQLTLEDKIRVLSIELENTTNLLKHSERINAIAETAKKELQTKLDNHLVQIISGEPLPKTFVPPPLSGDYTPLSDHIDLDESQMSYGTKSSTSGDSNSVSNDFVSCDNSDKSSEVNTNDFASSDSSVKSSEPKSNDSTSCASTSSVSTSESEAEIESNVGTPIQEPIIFCPQAVLLRTCKVNIPPARPQPVPTGKPKVPAPVPTGRQNRPFPASCEAFKAHENLKNLWSVFKFESPSFLVDERLIWLEIHGLPLGAWGSNAYKKVENNFGKFLFFDYDIESCMGMGRVFQEVGGWNILINDDIESTDTEDGHFDEECKSVNVAEKPLEDLDDILQPLEEEFEPLSSNNNGKSTHLETDSVGSYPPGFEKANFINNNDLPQEPIPGIILNVTEPQISPTEEGNSDCSVPLDHHGKVILFGDLNEVKDISERYGSLFSSGDAANFNSFIQDANLLNLPMGGKMFTWMNKAGTKTTNVPHLLEQYLFRHAEGRKSETRLLGGHFIGCLAMHFGLVSDEGLRGLHVEILAPAPAQGPPPPPPAPQPRTTSQRIERIERIEEEMRDLRHDVGGIRGVVESFTTEQSRVSTWLITYMTQLMMLAALLIRHLIAPSSVAHGCPTRGVSDPGQAMLAPPHPLMPMTSPTLNLFSL
ncbi:ribonuclease H-like domain-containing protein [Tanacetum coccineum]